MNESGEFHRAVLSVLWLGGFSYFGAKDRVMPPSGHSIESEDCVRVFAFKLG